MNRRAAGGLAATVLAAAVISACDSSGESTVPDDCEPAHEFRTLEEGLLTVSTYSLPPYTVIRDQELTIDGVSHDRGGTLDGVDGDILAEIAANECLEIEVFSTSAAAVLASVQSGSADLAAGNWYRTTERAEILDMSEPVYADEVGITSREGISDLTELQGRRVGTVVGYQYVADMRDYFAEGLVLFNSPLVMFQELEDGNIDAAVDTVGVGTEFTKDTDLIVEAAEPFEPIAASLEPGQSAFMVQQGNDDLLDALDANVEELRESGRLAEILEENGLDPAAAEPGPPRMIDG